MNIQRNIKNLPGIVIIITILLSMVGSPALAAPPSNDNFATARVVDQILYTDTVDTMEATTEDGEPSGCGYYFQQTIWYSFTPADSGSYTAEVINDQVPVLAIYTGTNFSDLQMIACRTDFGSSRASLWLETGTTYFFQVFPLYWWHTPVTFNLYPAPAPLADFRTTGTPGINYDTQFENWSYDPGGADFAASNWDFGDGSGSTDWSPAHRYQAVGDYTVLLTVTTSDGRTASLSQTITVQDLVPANDNFSSPKVVVELPYSDSVDITFATIESGEPTDCYGYAQNTIWYTFTPAASGLYTVQYGNWYAALAVYSGTELSNLQKLACAQIWSGDRIPISLVSGTTYYFQTFITDLYWGGTVANFSLYPTPSPEASFYTNPGDPNKFETIYFSNTTYDPGWIGIETCTWDFGDGSNASECFPSHHYTVDGDYNVQLTVTTPDGRTGSTTQTVSVWTHDVAITRLQVPTSSRMGQTKQINVSINNVYNPETVQVDLYKVTQNGNEQIGSVTKDVPIRPPSKAQVFTFNYTFTSDDAAIGKATFKAIVSTLNARDVFPSDNEATSLATKVTR